MITEKDIEDVFPKIPERHKIEKYFNKFDVIKDWKDIFFFCSETNKRFWPIDKATAQKTLRYFELIPSLQNKYTKRVMLLNFILWRDI